MSDKWTDKYDYKPARMDTARQCVVLDLIKDDRDTAIRNYKEETDKGLKDIYADEMKHHS